jgi:hypothetical protein
MDDGDLRVEDEEWHDKYSIYNKQRWNSLLGWTIAFQ